MKRKQELLKTWNNSRIQKKEYPKNNAGYQLDSLRKVIAIFLDCMKKDKNPDTLSGKLSALLKTYNVVKRIPVANFKKYMVSRDENVFGRDDIANTNYATKTLGDLKKKGQADFGTTFDVIRSIFDISSRYAEEHDDKLEEEVLKELFNRLTDVHNAKESELTHLLFFFYYLCKYLKIDILRY